MYKFSNNWLEMLKEKEFKKQLLINGSLVVDSGEDEQEEKAIFIPKGFAALIPQNLQIFPAL